MRYKMKLLILIGILVVVAVIALYDKNETIESNFKKRSGEDEP